MALACLADEAENAGDKLARRGYALIDGSAVDLRQAVSAFDALQVESDAPKPLAADHPLVAMLLDQPAVRALVDEALGPDAAVVNALASDQRVSAGGFQPWHQPAFDDTSARRLILRWHLDLIGPADGALRVLPGSHLKGRLSAEAVAALVTEIPAAEMAVSAGTVLALDPRLAQGARRRTTRGPRRILQVELTAAR